MTKGLVLPLTMKKNRALNMARQRIQQVTNKDFLLMYDKFPRAYLSTQLKLDNLRWKKIDENMTSLCEGSQNIKENKTILYFKESRIFFGFI